MSQAQDDLVAAASNPNTDLTKLHELANNYPGLRPYIATNPRTYPALLEWLGTLGDPAVDAALDRLEAAFLQRRRAAFVAKNGRQAWMDQVTQLATTLYPRLLRPAGERFAPASGQGYDKTDVDALMDRIAGYFDSDTTLTSSEVRGAVFRRARGNKAYGEPSVDRYLARVVEVLLSVE